MTIKLSKPKAYGKVKPLYGSNDQPIHCTPIESRQIVSLAEFNEALKLLVNQTSPTIPLRDIRDETEEVLSWFTC